jgi:esterase/lipase
MACTQLFITYKDKCQFMDQNMSQTFDNILSNITSYYNNIEKFKFTTDLLKNFYTTINTIKDEINTIESCSTSRINYERECFEYAYNTSRSNKLFDIITANTYSSLKNNNDNIPYNTFQNITNILRHGTFIQDILDKINSTSNYKDFKDDLSIIKLVKLNNEDLINTYTEIKSHIYPIFRLFTLSNQLKAMILKLYKQVYDTYIQELKTIKELLKDRITGKEQDLKDYITKLINLMKIITSKIKYINSHIDTISAQDINRYISELNTLKNNIRYL